MSVNKAGNKAMGRSRSKSLCFPGMTSLFSQHSDNKDDVQQMSYEQIKLRLMKLNEQREEDGEEEEEDNDDENIHPLLPRIYHKNSTGSLTGRRRKSLQFAPILDPSHKSQPAVVDGEAVNYHRRSSIKLGRYINNRVDLTRLNKIPLRRRYSINVVPGEFGEKAMTFPEITRRTSIHSPKPSHDNDVPNLSNIDPSTLKFGTLLSSSAQCALLKTYEDELYNRMRPYLSSYRSSLPRVTTAKFLSNAHSKKRPGVIFATTNNGTNKPGAKNKLKVIRDETPSSSPRASFSSASTPENGDKINENESSSRDRDDTKTKTKLPRIGGSNSNVKTLKDFGRIEDMKTRMKIADHLEKAMQLVEQIEHADATNIDEVVRKYERWQHKWSKMLEDCF